MKIYMDFSCDAPYLTLEAEVPDGTNAWEYAHQYLEEHEDEINEQLMNIWGEIPYETRVVDYFEVREDA